MHIDYRDITSRIAEAPLWWIDGVPRYDAFRPGMAPGNEAALMEAECQHCRRRFVICKSGWTGKGNALRMEVFQTRTIYLGDPPRHECGLGDIMTAVPLKIIEFWEKVRGTANYKRLPEYEITIENPFGKMDQPLSQ